MRRLPRSRAPGPVGDGYGWVTKTPTAHVTMMSSAVSSSIPMLSMTAHRVPRRHPGALVGPVLQPLHDVDGADERDRRPDPRDDEQADDGRDQRHADDLGVDARRPHPSGGDEVLGHEAQA